ncbi:hypothetical protein E2C01_031340 [Portunus trituberculatus]|uniref:Transmembrane protein n=1 Tax=Portunus trituberculatus TaxID=210409 RepID=A0A5B7EWK5_PORTR|nr:hypothetical protein [Portunus trituberculatus]
MSGGVTDDGVRRRWPWYAGDLVLMSLLVYLVIVGEVVVVVVVVVVLVADNCLSPSVLSSACGQVYVPAT